VRSLIDGRVVVAYHVHLKLHDLGLWNDIVDKRLDVKTLDCAVMYNRDHSG
jgi:hypothetical protein